MSYFGYVSPSLSFDILATIISFLCSYDTWFASKYGNIYGSLSESKIG